MACERKSQVYFSTLTRIRVKQDEISRQRSRNKISKKDLEKRSRISIGNWEATSEPEKTTDRFLFKSSHDSFVVTFFYLCLFVFMSVCLSVCLSVFAIIFLCNCLSLCMSFFVIVFLYVIDEKVVFLFLF